ncbi:hypothetical protein MNBD_ALPHA06-146 [hydrothermal vent metagenome]|uniref:VTT domain-containing protein n=1 Tax=hydrothermal vent metagenome TaxID=652676 RepID=A0A3B0RF91_9ZZZZ
MNQQQQFESRFTKARLVLFVGLLALLLFLLFSGFAPGAEKIEQLLAAVQENHLGLATVILVFVVMGLVGTPQFVLIGASVLVFGPVMGSLYSWVATMVSAGVNFWLGRWIGAPPLARFGGKRMAKISDYVSRNGLW